MKTLLVLSLLLVVASAHAQSPAQMESQEWADETNAFLSVARDLPESEVARLLVERLELGAQILESVLRGVADQKDVGEAFAEVYSSAFGLLWEVGRPGDQRVIEVLVRGGGYNYDSPWAVEVATQYGERVLPILHELHESDLTGRRYTAAGMFGMVLLHDENLPDATVRMAREAILRSTSDQDVVVRQAAITSLGQIGTLADIPLLERIVESDPYMSQMRPGRYPVRERASKAIQAIRARAPGGPGEF